MTRVSRYKITIGVLLFIVIAQALFILSLRPAKKRALPVSFKGRIAIVIDDWGYNLNNRDLLEQIKYPLTCSILPNLNYSVEIAEELHALKYEIILHLPMEPHEEYRLEKNTILTSMDDADIRDIIAEALAGIPFVRGVSNHMGSKATEDTRTMESVFRELRKRRLYFLDSVVSPDSVCSDLAPKSGVGFAKRDVFLDNVEERAYIRGQLSKLKAKARSSGEAIGIGHDRRTTLEVLKEAIPQIEKEGYRLVYVSELVR